MKRRGFLLFIFNFIYFVLCDMDVENDLMVTKEDILAAPNFVNWPGGNIPFFINPEHFDNEQTLIIMTSLSLVAFKTCLKFAPVMVQPADNEHVLTFENPHGTRKCEIHLGGHSKTEPHVVILGYDCLEAPWMDRILLRALGLPFEHNRQSRDSYIDVQYENIEQHAIPLFTKDIALPAALRALPYDINSVMHFGDRDYSKNGHRTIIFKDRQTKQKWDGISELDLRKIEIIYGDECIERDRKEKIELCHMYPGIPLADRKKRSVVVESVRSLRVNPDITPPAETNMSNQVQNTLKNLDIEAEVEKIVNDVFKVSNKALVNTRAKYCNGSKDVLRSTEEVSDIHGIIRVVADYAQAMVDHAINNLTSFCAESESIENYQRQRCRGCARPYYSTKIVSPYPSTKHRPYIPQSTKHVGGPRRPPFDPPIYHLRARDDTAEEKPQNDTNGKSHERKKRQALGTALRQVKQPVNTKVDPKNSMEDIEVRKKRSRRGITEPSRVGSSRKPKSKSGAIRRGYSEEVEDDDTQSSEEGGEKGNQPNVDSEETPDETSIKNGKPKNNGREGKKKIERPMRQESQEKIEDSTEGEINDEKSEERNSKKKRKPPKKIMPHKKSDEEETSAESIEKVPKRGKISRSPQTVALSKENEEFYKERKWPDGVVRYMINRTSTQFDIRDLRRRLRAVNNSLTLNTCVHIEELTEEDAKKHEDYLVIDNSPDFVTGRVGGRQIFGTPELLVGGQHRQHAAMMVMAMLGFYFELSRHDRDEYVKVHQRHIRADKLHHFEKIGADATLPVPYDYESATHPAWMFWRKQGKKGISTVATYKDKDPDGSIMKSLGQHKKLFSETDYIKINSVYGVKCMMEDNVNQPKEDWD